MSEAQPYEQPMQSQPAYVSPFPGPSGVGGQSGGQAGSHMTLKPMSKALAWICRALSVVFVFALANAPAVICATHATPRLFWPALFAGVIVLVGLLVAPAPYKERTNVRRLKTCRNAVELLIVFLLSAAASVVFGVLGMAGVFEGIDLDPVSRNAGLWIANSICAVVVEALVFWPGMIRAYVASEQLGIRWRVAGLVCGMIPIAHLVVLGFIIKTLGGEVEFETAKERLDARRAPEQVCATRYPIIMVHGVFFRDFRYVNYWGRIAPELERNGARVFYGNQQSALPVAASGLEVAERIRQVLAETGAEKVNLIGHSKGGLDCRSALTVPGISEHVASLTTINTPHRGCEFADYLFGVIPEGQKNALAATYNAALRKLGDASPDFLSAVWDLTAEGCLAVNQRISAAMGAAGAGVVGASEMDAATANAAAASAGSGAAVANMNATVTNPTAASAGTAVASMGAATAGASAAAAGAFGTSAALMDPTITGAAAASATAASMSTAGSGAAAIETPMPQANAQVIGTAYPIPYPSGIFCQSVGSTLAKARGGRFPLNFTFEVAKRFDGPNDGLVGEMSFPWGERYQMLTAPTMRGISHGDMVDLNRENIPGFDVREFYVQLVSDLKARGF